MFPLPSLSVYLLPPLVLAMCSQLLFAPDSAESPAGPRPGPRLTSSSVHSETNFTEMGKIALTYILTD